MSRADLDRLWDQQKFVLEQNREELKRRIDLYKGRGVLEILQRNRTLDAEEIQLIQSRSSEEDEVDELITRIQRKSDSRSYDALCRAVIETEQQVIHDSYLNCESVTFESVRDLQQMMIHYLQNDFCLAPMLTANEEGHLVDLDTIYVDTTFAIYEKTLSSFRKSPLARISDVFVALQTGHPRNTRVLIRGIPMAGKSVLIKKLAYDWAAATRDESCGNSAQDGCSELSRFSMIVPLMLRTVEQNTSDRASLTELLSYHFSSIGFTEKHLRTLKWLLSDDPAKILFLLDGLDELNQNITCIQRLIEGQDYKESVCLVTSRAEKDTVVPLFSKFCMQISMEGFSEAQMQSYTKKFFESDSRKFNRFNADLQSQPDNESMREVSFNPGWLEINCLLWNEDGQFRTSKKQLLNDFLKLCLLHAEEREGWPDHASSVHLLETSEYHRDMLVRFGKLALSGQPSRWQFTFTKDDIQKFINERDMKYGLLYKILPTDRLSKGKFTFIGRCFQEWLAAFYIHVASMSIAQIELQYNPETISAFTRDISFHKIVKDFSHDSLEHIFTNFVRNYRQPIARFDDYCIELEALYLWHKNVGVAPEVFTNLNETAFAETIKALSFHFCGRIDSLGTAIGHTLSALTNCAKVDLSSPQLPVTKETVRDIEQSLVTELPQVKSLSLSSGNLQGGGVAVGELMKKMSHCTDLQLNDCQFTTEDFAEFVSVTTDALAMIRKFNYSGNTLQGTGQIIGQLLLQMPSCTEINLMPVTPNKEHQLLTHQDWDAMASVLQNHRLLVETMKIKHQTFAKACESLGKIMLCMPNHKQWNLSGQGLEKHDFADLVRGIDNKQLDVTHLYLWPIRAQHDRFGNKANNLMGAGCSTGKLMLLMPLVSIWHFRGLGLTTQDIKEMSEAVARNMLVVEALHLSENNITGSGTFLASLLCAMPRCTLLNLYQCHLIPADVGPLVDTFEGNNIQLQKMDLSSNHLHGAGSTIGRLLVLLSSCNDFRIDRCDLDKSDVEEMVNVIGNIQISVENLDLGHNNLTEGGYSLGKLILQAPSCTSLKVVACKMTTSDLDDITNAASHQTFKLEELDLRYNNFHSGSAEEAMRKMVAKMPALTTCKMEKCGLMPMLEYYRLTLEESVETLRLK